MASKPPQPPPALPVDVGRPAPTFALPDQDGKTHRLEDYRGRWVLLYFYPKDDTSGCTKEACAFRDDFARYEDRGVVILGVSPDDEKSHRKFADKFDLPFPLLADTDKRVCQAYGVWKLKSMYGRKYLGVERTTYLIDPRGVVARRWDKVKVAAHSAEVLAAVAESVAS